MKAWARNKQGFTIVELLIVIVVIAILAAITIVAFNGIQTRAENAKTISAVTAWAKALRMYESDNGSWPTVNSCLGAASTYTDSYSGRCWAPETNSTWVVNATFLSQMQPYISSYPEPSTKSTTTTDPLTQYRGAMFFRATVTDMRVYVMLLGVSTCPDISGLGAAFGGANDSDGRRCYYRLSGP